MTMPSVPSGASAALTRVRRGDLCAGCGACAAIAPGKVTMTAGAPGFLRPVVSAPLSAGEDAAIARTCPGLGQCVEAAGRTDDPLWGPYLEMRTGWATDPALRHAGASGGALSALLAHLLAKGKVEAVVTNGPDPEIAIANRTALVSAPADLLATAGSRYAPSAPLAALPDWLAEHRQSGRRFAFVGKPCDVAALAVLRDRDPQIAAAFPVLVSFFCAGVPSQTGAREILTALGLGGDEVTAFRYRGNGWPGRATATLGDGSTRSMSYFDSWGRILSRHVQHRCKICADGTGTAADLVCADAWESDARGYPVFDERPGVSLIVVRTAQGAAILAAAEAAGRVETAPFDTSGLAKIQTGQAERRRGLQPRLAALRVLGRPIPRYTGLRLRDAARQTPVLKRLKNFLGMARRVLLRGQGRPVHRRDPT